MPSHGGPYGLRSAMVKRNLEYDGARNRTGAYTEAHTPASQTPRKVDLARRRRAKGAATAALGLTTLALLLDARLLVKATVLHLLQNTFASQSTLQTTKGAINTSVHLDLERSKLQFTALNVLHGITYPNGKSRTPPP